MAVAKPDLLLLELEAEMLKRVGSSLRRVKKRLVDTDLTFQLKPPETEALELANWEARVSSLVNYTDTMSFPKLLDFKRQFAARQHGIAKEQARCVLPEGNTVSRLYMNGSMRSWIHFIEVRCGNGTQKEHAEVALECAKIIAELFPIVL